MTTAETITLVTNIILYSLLGLILIKCLIGLFKGLWKTTCSLVISIIFYILVITLNTTFTELYYGINLSFISSTPIIVNNVEVTISTIGDTLREVVMALTEGTLNLTKSDPVFKVCDALAMSILSFFVFILHIIIVTFIISPIISTLVYHLILKNILGSNITKKHKLKLAGFFVGGLKATITMGLLLTPFTALANQIGSVVSNEKYQFEGDADELKSYVDAYSNSSLAKVLTTFKINGNSLDVCLTNAATTFKVDDNNISFLDELAMVTDIACVGMQEGIITLSGVSTEVSAYLSKNFVTSVLIDLADSSLVTTLLPVTLGIICNLDNIKENIDLTSVDWNIDWQDELTALSDVYAEFYDTGLISAILNPEELNSYEFSRDTYQHFKTTFERMNDIEILNDVMPHVLASFARSLEENESALSGIFPTDVEKYKGIEIGKELGCIYDAVMTLSDLSSYAFNDSTEVNINKNKNVASNNETRRYLTIGDLQDSEKMSTLISFLLSENGVKGGDVDDEGNVTVEYKSSTKESYSINTELVFNGNDKINGLLDSTLISNNIVSLLKYAFNSNEEMKALDLWKVLDDIEKDSSDYVWKEEVSSLLNICSVIMNLDFDNFNIFEDAEELRKITPYINDSKLITKLAPTIVTTFLGEEEIIYGLYAKNFEFGCEDLGTEIDNLLSVLPKINDLQNSLSNGINGLIDSDSMAKDIEDILNTIYASKIINPEPESGLSNFEVIVKNVFGDENLIKSGFEELDGDTLMKIRDADGGWKGEIGNICSALENLSKNDTLKKLIDPNKYNEGKDVGINDIDASDVSTLIEDFASSTIIEHSLGSVLNKYLQGQMEEMGVSVNFKAVNDWGKEADNLANVITSIQELDGRFSLGSEDIKITSLQYYRVNELDEIVSGADDIGSILESLSKLQSVSEEIVTNDSITYKNKFGDVVYNITEQMLGSYMECKDSDGNIDQVKTDKLKEEIRKDHNFSEDENSDDYVPDVFWVKTDDNFTTNGNYVIDDMISIIDEILGTSEKKFDLNKHEIGEDGKITDIVIKSDYVVDGEISFSDFEFNDSTRKIIIKLNKNYIFRSLITPILGKEISSLNGNITEINPSKAYISVFDNEYNYKNENGKKIVYDRREEVEKRETELNLIIDIFGYMESLENATGDNKYKGLMGDNKDEEGIIENLLKKSNKSKVLSMVEPNYEGDDKNSSIFEDAVKYILDQTTLTSYIEYEYKEITKENRNVKTIIKKITSSDKYKWEDSNENTKDGEISKLCDVLFDLTHLETKDSTSEVKQYVNFNDSTKINSINTESAKTFMESLNESYLCHGAVGSVVNKIYEETGIMDYALDRNNLINAHYLDYDSENSGLKEFSEQKELWGKDIDPLFELYNVIGANGDVNDSIIDFDGENEKVKEDFFASVIPNLMKLQNVKNCHSDILYGLFSELNLDGYIYEYEVEQYSDDDSDKSTIQHYYVMKGEEKYDSNIVSTSGGLVTKYYSITDFARRDTLKILINEKITDWEFEGERLDKVANEVYTNTSSSIKTLDSNMVYNVLSSTYKYDELDVTDNNFEARYKRGYLASELVSSFLAQNSVSFVSGESNKDTYLSTFWRGKDKDGNLSFDYKEINKYEIEALKATKDAITLIGEITNKDSSFNYKDWKYNYNVAMISMGCSCNENAEKEYCFTINGGGDNSPIAKLLWNSMSNSEVNAFKNKYHLTTDTNANMGLGDGEVFHEKYRDTWIEAFNIAAMA